MPVLWVVLGIVVLLALAGVVAYNRFVSQKQLIKDAWANIDTELRRRYDLIPNIVESVKGYAAHEREVFEEVARMRSQAQSASGPQAQAQAENELTRSINRLIAVAERYPDLKASQNFLALQEELTGTESRIAYARQFYNDEVAKLNTAIQTFPSRIIARMGNFQPAEFFETDEQTRGPVAVRL